MIIWMRDSLVFLFFTQLLEKNIFCYRKESAVPGSSFPMRVPQLPLLLKIAAAAGAGALAIIAVMRLRRDDAVASLRQEIRDTLGTLGSGEDEGDAREVDGEEEGATTRPPSVLITGFRAHGKSSLVNTACRALAAEDGPLLMRAEASPPGGVTDGTRRRKRVKAAVSCGDGEVGGDPVVELIDAPPLPEAARLLRSDMDLAISGGGPECVVLVLRCDAPTKERNAAVKRLPEISAAVRAKGQSASRRFQNCPPCLVFVLFIVGRLFMRPDPHTYTRHHQPW
jgi:hypothetical protein